MREEYFGSTNLYCAHPWKLKEEEEEEEEEEKEKEEEEEEEEERVHMIYDIVKIRYTKKNKDKWKGSNTNTMWERVSFASKWKTRNRKVIVWVFNTYSDINKINEKVWNNLKKDTSPTENELVWKTRRV